MAKLYGIGVGPGDSELMTLKGARLIKECDIVVLPKSGKKINVAFEIAKKAVPEIMEKEMTEVDMPMTRDRDILNNAHKKAAEKIISYLDQGKDVVFLTLGDPTIYSTYCYVHNLILDSKREAELVPGVPSFCAVAARLNESLTEASESLHIIPASYEGLKEAITLSGTKVLMKSGKAMKEVKKALEDIREGESVRMVECCGMPEEKIYDELDQIDDEASYFSVLVVKKR